MAPRKTAAGDKTPKAKKAPAVKKSEDKIVKRPARGYHKFRNGLLNVTPKGGEKELAKQNHNSPLLRMPAEIRNEIWKFALGGKEYKAGWSGRFCPLPTESKNAAALLRTCRQIYAEAALMPLTLATFSGTSSDQAKKALSKLKPHQRKQIMVFHLLCPTPDRVALRNCCRYFLYRFSFERLLPNLQALHIRIYGAEDTSTFNTYKEWAREYLKLLKQYTSVAVNVEHTSQLWSDYARLWHHTA